MRPTWKKGSYPFFASRPLFSDRAAGLFVVFVAAKAAALMGHHVPLSWWSPIAYFWQDALVVLVFAAIDRSLGDRERRAFGTHKQAEHRTIRERHEDDQRPGDQQ